jgi:hypothetical protein
LTREISPIDNAYNAYNADPPSLGLYYREYDRLMRLWDTVFPGQILQNRYEDLVSDQERQSRRLIGPLGVPWDDCLSAVLRQRRFGQYIQPLAGSRADLRLVDESLEEALSSC